MSHLRFYIVFPVYIWAIFFTLIFAHGTNTAINKAINLEQIQDSLKKELTKTKIPHKRVNLLLDLKDLNEEKEEKEFPYNLQLFEESKKAKDVYGMATALVSIVKRYSTYKEKEDSLYNYYLAQMKAIEKGTPAEGMTTASCIYIKTSQIFGETDKKKQKKLCQNILLELKENQAKEDKYQKIKRLFLKKYIQLYLQDSHKQKDFNNSFIDSWQNSWDTALTFPDYSRRHYLSIIYPLLSNAYIQNKDYENLKKVTQELMNEYDRHYILVQAKYPRPFLYKDNIYVQCYLQLLKGAINISDEEASAVYNQFRKYMFSAKDIFLERNKMLFFQVTYKFCNSIGKNQEALIYCDSLIQVIEEQKITGYINISTPYKDKAILLQKLQRLEEAYNAYDNAMTVSDSLIKKEYISRVETMRIKHDLDTLQLEKARLLAHNRKAAFILTLCVLLIAIAISWYYYKTLKRTKKLQKEIAVQSIKAQESEQLKSAFINSICHEIRTPLNAINGFSEILTDESTSLEEKKEFRNIIQENTSILTSLLGSLIEVANLDSLTKDLALIKTEIGQLCTEEMAFLKNNEAKSGIQYRLQLPQEECWTYTHPQYFSLLIRSLLNNANKFTQKGSICLECTPDSENKKIVIAITDTGCGIPEDKHEYIFKKFTKLDTFTQGSGLGLYLCRLIAWHINGDIQIDKTYKQGARFTLTIPLERN